MNINEFIAKFNDLITYQIDVKIGGHKSDKSKIGEVERTNANLKGKVYPFYKKNLAETETTYLPANEISLPIDIKVECNEAEYIIFDNKNPKNGEPDYLLENPIKYTNKKNSEHNIRILNGNKEQIGFTSLNLNASGDIERKYSSYRNKDRSHEVIYTSSYKIEANELQKTITIDFNENDYETNISTSLKIYKYNDKVVGITIEMKKILTQEEKMLIPIAANTFDINAENNYFFLSKGYLVDENDISKRAFRPLENIEIEDALLEYNRGAQRLSRISEDRLWHYERLKYYVNAKENNLLRDYIGNYVGNIVYMNKEKTTLYVITEKDGLNFYTEVDLTGARIYTDYCGMDDYFGETHHERLKTAPKILKFITKIIDGEEQLVDYENFKFSDELQKEFESFKNNYIDSFTGVEKIKIGKILKK